MYHASHDAWILFGERAQGEITASGQLRLKCDVDVCVLDWLCSIAFVVLDCLCVLEWVCVLDCLCVFWMMDRVSVILFF